VTLNRQDFVWRTHSYINDYIRLADVKAGALFAVFGALVGVLVHQWAAGDEPETWWRKALFGSAIGASALVIALALEVVRPRLDAPSTKNDSKAACGVFWRRICGQTLDEYRRTVETLDANGLLAAVAAHTWEIAHVAEKKYTTLRWAFLVSYVALPLAVLGTAVL
jgi:hypothetical protein